MGKDNGFSFASLIKPGAGSLQALQRQIETMHVREARTAKSHWFYTGAGQLLMHHGQFWNGRELPDKWDHHIGPPGHCHGNTLRACQAEPELRYFTGLYMVGLLALPHSWAVDASGEVVELTVETKGVEQGAVFADELGRPMTPWLPPRHWAYVGMEYDIDFIVKYDDARGLPIIDPFGFLSARGGEVPVPSYTEDEELPMWTHVYTKAGFPFTDAPQEIQDLWNG